MRGYPPLQIFVVILAFFLLAFPLWKLTWGNRSNEASVEKTASEEISAESGKWKEAVLTIRCAHAPVKLQLITAGGVAGNWEKEEKWPQTLTIPIDLEKPVEIAIAAQWPPDVQSTAVTVDFSPDGRETRSETRWSIGPQIDDVFTFNPTAR